MQLRVTAEYTGKIRSFTLDVESTFGNPGSNDDIEEAAAIVFSIPYEDREFIDILDVE